MKYGRAIETVDPEATEALTKYQWPGNVRELENCIARAIILSKGSHIGLKDLPERMREPSDHAPSDRDRELVFMVPDGGIRIRDMERELIEKTLEKCNGNKTLAANYLGISRKALYEKMERYRIGL
jgi:DNA-binding NtrC family response regulator